MTWICEWCEQERIGVGTLNDGTMVGFCDEHYAEYRAAIGAPPQGGLEGASMQGPPK